MAYNDQRNFYTSRIEWAEHNKENPIANDFLIAYKEYSEYSCNETHMKMDHYLQLMDRYFPPANSFLGMSHILSGLPVKITGE